MAPQLRKLPAVWNEKGKSSNGGAGDPGAFQGPTGFGSGMFPNSNGHMHQYQPLKEEEQHQREMLGMKSTLGKEIATEGHHKNGLVMGNMNNGSAKFSAQNGGQMHNNGVQLEHHHHNHPVSKLDPDANMFVGQSMPLSSNSKAGSHHRQAYSSSGFFRNDQDLEDGQPFPWQQQQQQQHQGVGGGGSNGQLPDAMDKQLLMQAFLSSSNAGSKNGSTHHQLQVGSFMEVANLLQCI